MFSLLICSICSLIELYVNVIVGDEVSGSISGNIKIFVFFSSWGQMLVYILLNRFQQHNHKNYCQMNVFVYNFSPGYHIVLLTPKMNVIQITVQLLMWATERVAVSHCGYVKFPLLYGLYFFYPGSQIVVPCLRHFLWLTVLIYILFAAIHCSSFYFKCIYQNSFFNLLYV